MDDGLPWGESPIDVQDNQAPGIGWTVCVLAVSSALLVLFNSHAIANWANQLTISTKTAPLVTESVRWNKITGRIGLNKFVDEVESGANLVRKFNWPNFENGHEHGSKSDAVNFSDSGTGHLNKQIRLY